MSSKESSVLSAAQIVFSPNGCTPEVSATTSAGPVAVFSPWIPAFEHPLHAHLPSAQGHVPVSPPH
ncbi:hypothetical protein HO173_008474 [Letharia columbiana]|uniref:Uncharacterized protein n=1 Tax=Letharia columbiana TaxID=112416 RepID=A0A8H6L2S2_9LECA|nr:uncharacterized protein HO173_008474 [Letharia columbiana]KAF6233350.1 hypothetical protein HO173_008474 [Letharia columbiana]